MVGGYHAVLFMIVPLHGRLERFSAYRGLPGGVPRDGYCTGILTE